MLRRQQQPWPPCCLVTGHPEPQTCSARGAPRLAPWSFFPEQQDGAGGGAGGGGLQGAAGWEQGQGPGRAPQAHPSGPRARLLEGSPHLQGQCSGPSVGTPTPWCTSALCLIFP